MTQTRLYSTKTRKNCVGFVSCSRVVSNFVGSSVGIDVAHKNSHNESMDSYSTETIPKNYGFMI